MDVVWLIARNNFQVIVEVNKSYEFFDFVYMCLLLEVFLTHHSNVSLLLEGVPNDTMKTRPMIAGYRSL